MRLVGKSRKKLTQTDLSVKLSFHMSSNIEQFEQQLDSFDSCNARTRWRNCGIWPRLEKSRWRTGQRRQSPRPHVFSYNAYGYSPSKFAWLARKRGWRRRASWISTCWTRWRNSGGGQTHRPEALREPGIRTFVPEFSTRVINSPANPASPITWASVSRAKSGIHCLSNAKHIGGTQPRTHPPRE